MVQKKDLMTQRSCRRELSEQRLNMLWAESVKHLALRLLPEGQRLCKNPLALLRERHDTHPMIFAHLNPCPSLLAQRAQIVRQGRPIHPHQIRQAVDRDGRGLGKGRQQRKLRDMQTARSKDRIDEERVSLLEKLLLWC